MNFEKRRKITFVVKVDGKDKELAVVRPNQRQSLDAQKEYNKAFRAAWDSDAVLRDNVEKMLKEQNLWGPEKQEEYEKLQSEIRAGCWKLKAGGFKKVEAKKVALEVKELRRKLRELTAPRNDLEGNSVESQAENARFNFYVSCCTVDDATEKPYFTSLDNYIENISGDVAREAARHMVFLLYNMDENYDAELPENKFLVTNGFGKYSEKFGLRLLNEKGQMVDDKGKLIREDGRFVNEENKLVDIDGHEIDEDGNYVVTTAPFVE